MTVQHSIHVTLAYYHEVGRWASNRFSLIWSLQLERLELHHDNPPYILDRSGCACNRPCSSRICWWPRVSWDVHGRKQSCDVWPCRDREGRRKNVVHFLDDFFFDDALDLKVALGKDGYDRSTLMGNLKKNSGKSSYEIPASIDPSQYNEVWIWCEKFNVPLSVAKIN